MPTRYSPVRHSVILKSTRKSHLKCFVRLACVKHAASVHPEPGSNSLIKCCSIQSDNVLAIFPFTVFKGQFLRKKSLRIFSRLSHCSVIKVLLDRFPDDLSVFRSVTFRLFCCLSTGATLISYHVFFGLSTTFFDFFHFFILFRIKRRRRDLNPRTAINDLLPFQGSPFSRLGTSPHA